MVHSKKLKILIDTNVIIDSMIHREPFYEASDAVIKLCRMNRVSGAIACHSFPTIWYILRKAGTDQMIRDILLALLQCFEVPETGKKQIKNALERTDFSDYEDCLQDETALSVKADYIITRNVKDFENSKIPAMQPEEFMEMMSS